MSPNSIRQMLEDHDRWHQTDVNKPRLMHTCLGRYCLTMADTNFPLRTCYVCWLQKLPITLSWCAHKTFDAYMPWQVSPDIGRRRFNCMHMWRPIGEDHNRCFILLLMHTSHALCILVDAHTQYLMHACIDRCVLILASIISHVRSCYAQFLQSISDVLFYWPMHVGHKSCSPADVLTPQLMLACLYWCNITLAYVCRPRMMSPTQCAHATAWRLQDLANVDANGRRCFPLAYMLHSMLSNNNRWRLAYLQTPSLMHKCLLTCPLTLEVCFLYTHMLRPMREGHDKWILLLADAHSPLLMSPSRCTHTRFDACMSCQMSPHNVKRQFSYTHMLRWMCAGHDHCLFLITTRIQEFGPPPASLTS